jgi:uncharacterized protein YceH (UPF0502 family)
MAEDDLKRLLEGQYAETRRHFDEVADRIEAQFADSRHLFKTTAEDLRKEIRLVAEGVVTTREALDREIAHVRHDIARTTAETQAMIRFSHAELDRRVRTLEETVADLQTRVERLEGSTH